MVLAAQSDPRKVALYTTPNARPNSSCNANSSGFPPPWLRCDSSKVGKQRDDARALLRAFRCGFSTRFSRGRWAWNSTGGQDTSAKESSNFQAPSTPNPAEATKQAAGTNTELAVASAAATVVAGAAVPPAAAMAVAKDAEALPPFTPTLIPKHKPARLAPNGSIAASGKSWIRLLSSLAWNLNCTYICSHVWFPNIPHNETTQRVTLTDTCTLHQKHVSTLCIYAPLCSTSAICLTSMVCTQNNTNILTKCALINRCWQTFTNWFRWSNGQKSDGIPFCRLGSSLDLQTI